jgi:hypothetical protein
LKRSFSFTEKPVLFILRTLPALIPGIDKVLAAYWSPEQEDIAAVVIRKESGEYLTEGFHIADTSSIIKRLRMDSAPYTWLRSEDLPFDIKHKEKIQLNIFNEISNNILLVRVKSQADEHSDLFFFYFNQDLSNFGTVSANKILSTDNKTIIAHLVRNAIISRLQGLWEDREVYATQVENTRYILNELAGVKKDLKTLNNKIKEGLSQICFSYLNEISANHARNYRLSESALTKLKEYQGNFQDLKTILDKAAGYADTQSQEVSDARHVLISDYHIFFNIENERKPVEAEGEDVGEVPVKYAKTLILLDRLETAAKQLKARNMLLTSSNIGSEFPKPISPPAITDALKKHRPKILFLFKEYPGRWQVIRSEFRPVQNILNARPGREKLSA